MKKKIRLVSLSLLATGIMHAQGPTSDYLKTINSFVQPAPQASQIMKYVDYPVNLFTGTPQVDVPVYTLSGSGISVPISISYHAGGGIKIDEMSGNIGLGWALNAGGEITREIRGNPDDGTGGAGYYLGNNPHSISFYKNSFQLTGGGYTDYQLWVDVNSGLADLEPDIYYFSFNGYSGKFVYDETQSAFVGITDNKRLKISFDAGISSWTIIADDGSKYFFASKESNSTAIQTFGSGPLNGPAGPDQVTSWKLTKIVNADATDSVMFTYGGPFYTYYSTGSDIVYENLSGNAQQERQPIHSYSFNAVTGSSKLLNITGSRFKVDFVDETTPRQDMMAPKDKALSKIIIKNKQDEVQDIFVMYHSYYYRPANVGINPGGDDLKYSLKLDSIREYGNSESNPNPLTHAFTYNATPLPRRLSFAKDFWGYANTNDNNDLLAPTCYLEGNQQTYPGANRGSDENSGKAGILEKIVLPTGGSVQFEYEANTVGYPVGQATSLNIIDGGMRRFVFKHAMELFDPIYRDTFIVNQPLNAVINLNQGGVFANIMIDPQLPITTPGYPVYNSSAGPYFDLIKFADIPGATPTGAFSMTFQYANVSSQHLPNGKYVMVTHTNTLNDPSIVNSIRLTNFTVSFPILDVSAISQNYKLAGLRVKSITSKDRYSNVTNTRNFKYHDLVTDSSFGKFIGTTVNNYIETGGGAGNYHQYLVRTGSNNMPGQGNSSANVVYGKVIEDVTTNNVTYRTEHTYSNNSFFYPRYDAQWPFAPPEDRENERGSEILTEWKKDMGNNVFVNAKSSQHIYDFKPQLYSDTNTYFSRVIWGIKCTNSSYDQSHTGGVSYPPERIEPYPIHVNDRTYLISDSTTTYDISNANRGITQWHDYMYGDNNMQPMVIRSGNSDGSVSIQKNYYASDMPDANTNINSTLASQMVAANRVTQPLGTMQYKDGQLLSQQYTYSHFEGSKLLVDSMRQALFNNPLDVEIKVLSYSPFANPLSILLRGSKYRRYIWNDALGLPLATCVSGQDSKFVFTSFEYPNELTWTETSRNTSGSFSGKYAYSLTGATAISATGFNATYGLDVYVWSTGSGITANGTTLTSTGKTKGSWTLYTTHLPNVATVTLSGNALIDQLLILPSGSQFQGNVYDGMNRVTAVVNDQILTSFYEYDNFGRLSTVKDEQGNILKTTSYQYQGPQ